MTPPDSEGPRSTRASIKRPTKTAMPSLIEAIKAMPVSGAATTKPPMVPQVLLNFMPATVRAGVQLAIYV